MPVLGLYTLPHNKHEQPYIIIKTTRQRRFDLGRWEILKGFALSKSPSVKSMQDWITTFFLTAIRKSLFHYVSSQNSCQCYYIMKATGYESCDGKIHTLLMMLQQNSELHSASHLSKEGVGIINFNFY
jgi:hypothetical protein